MQAGLDITLPYKLGLFYVIISIPIDYDSIIELVFKLMEIVDDKNAESLF